MFKILFMRKNIYYIKEECSKIVELPNAMIRPRSGSTSDSCPQTIVG